MPKRTNNDWLCRIEAAAGDGAERRNPRISGVAYSGDVMNVGYWPYPVAMELSGLELPESVPVLADHANSIMTRLGDAHATIENGRLTYAGEITAENSDEVKAILEHAKNGGKLQVSVGADPIEYRLVKGTVEVNGQSVKGPFFHMKRALLREISVVAVGADPKTSAHIAAAWHMKPPVEAGIMEFEKWLEAKGITASELTDAVRAELEASWKAEMAVIDAVPDGDDGNAVDPKPVKAKAVPVKPAIAAAGADPVGTMRADAAAEKQRIGEVTTICASYKGQVDEAKLNAISVEAIKEAWTRDATELALLRAARPASVKAPTGSRNTGTGSKVLEAALCLGAGMTEDTTAEAVDAESVDAARVRFGGPIGPARFILEAAWAAGWDGRSIHPGNMRSALTAAFSTQAASDILSNTANKLLLDAYSHVDASWKPIAKIGLANDFKEQTHYRLTGDMIYEEVGPGGELKHASTADENWTNQAKTYGKMFSITRTDIINDDLGAFDDLRRMLGRGAALALNKTFWTAFLDNSAFFTGARNNYASGTSTALDSAALGTAVQMFRDQTDTDGYPLGIAPNILLVPTALEQTAAELYKSTNVNTGGSSTTAKVPSANIYAGQYLPVVSSYLSNSSFTGNSSAAWYLLADPADMPVIEVSFLNGKQTPTIESADADFNTLGIHLRGFHDFGVSKAEYRGGVKMVGA